MRRRPFRRFSKKRSVIAFISLLLWIVWLLFYPSKKSTDTGFLTETESSEISSDYIRVCTWNVHNYNVSNRRACGGRWISYPKPEEERNAVCATLAKIDADIVLLQEMGDLTYLRDLHSRLSKVGKNYAFAIVSSFDAPSRLAILSRVKPEDVFDFSDTKIVVKGEKTFSPRGALGIKIKLNDEILYAFSIHLKSKVGAKDNDEGFMPFRFAELRAIRKKVENVTGKNTKVIFGGDFNDEPKKRLLRNLGNVELVSQRDFTGLAYTYHWRKKNVFYQYDYFVVSSTLSPFIKKHAVVVPNGEASDHRPVYVDILLNKDSGKSN